MAQIQISDAALADLDSIWRYTMRQWSIAKADEYYLLLRGAMVAARDNPGSGSPVEIIQNCRRMRTGSHYVYYRPSSGGVLILRILHQSMDERQHLPL